jgi:His/Glu/Gln/Arg/opine family amino acid ABC transporter permease subunit
MLASSLALFWDVRVALLRGLGETLLLTLAAQALALVLAIPTAVARMSDRPYLKRTSGAYVEFTRGTPALVQVFWIYYCVPIFTGIQWSPLVGAIVALGLNVGAYDAESFRAGIQSVHRGQTLAARALGMSRFTAFWEIVLPQATRYVLPSLLNNFIGLLLFTSIASTIGVQELTRVAGMLNAATYKGVAVFSGIAIIYLCSSLFASLGVRRLEYFYAKRD